MELLGMMAVGMLGMLLPKARRRAEALENRALEGVESCRLDSDRQRDRLVYEIVQRGQLLGRLQLQGQGWSLYECFPDPLLQPEPEPGDPLLEGSPSRGNPGHPLLEGSPSRGNPGHPLLEGSPSRGNPGLRTVQILPGPEYSPGGPERSTLLELCTHFHAHPEEAIVLPDSILERHDCLILEYPHWQGKTLASLTGRPWGLSEAGTALGSLLRVLRLAEELGYRSVALRAEDTPLNGESRPCLLPGSFRLHRRGTPLQTYLAQIAFAVLARAGVSQVVRRMSQSSYPTFAEAADAFLADAR